ncbi:rhamnogalacturonan acetylesterase [Desertivirga brevis]|uniref:rhamnogalacturonan acetylesterase n=1 Tax=Desertivirga brevis TaxID=2810310 RepID=UPI001A956682|nr:rhamnogalacturonan acetylesterase [Pedobacter sp. SYSU D00873]
MKVLATLLGGLFVSGLAFSQTRKFDFGPGALATGYTQILPGTTYTKEKGYGFLPGATLTGAVHGKNALKNDFITSDQPFYFTVDLPEGDYNVKVTLGDKNGTSEQTVRAECRRLMAYKQVTNQGEIREKTFTVHIRTPEIADSNERVKLKPREINYFHWDNQLTLEFNGAKPKVAAIEIKKADKPIRVFLAGNSTVVDQASEPFAAWGQMLPAFLEPKKISVANYAESGETLSNFLAGNRLKKILSQMRKGDYLFIEFGHNDQKQKGEGIGPFTSYKRDLKYFISEARKKGGIPVIVTSIQRRNFNENGQINETLGDYPAACRQTAQEENVPLIDLNKMTKSLYEAWGPEESEKAFAHNPQIDNTHPNPFGAYEMAKCVVQGIKDIKLDLARYIIDFKSFDPAKPDLITSFYWPLSPSKSTIKPDGN